MNWPSLTGLIKNTSIGSDYAAGERRTAPWHVGRSGGHRLQASNGEVRLAVDLYNRSGHERQLEAFIIHMTLGCGSDCCKPYRTAGW